MSPLYFWIAFALVFLIIELMTATFYSLSLSVACAIVALLSYLMHDTAFTIFQ